MTVKGNGLASLASGLHQLARNIWWTWNQNARDLFAELSPRGWQLLHHNPVAVLHEVSDYELRMRLGTPEFSAHARAVLADFHAYLENPDSWVKRQLPALVDRGIAYFSAEFGLHETLPIAAGGLGVLAGDFAKSASDLGLNFMGVSLFYREGYFQQAINQDNWQTEYYTLLHPRNLPIEPVLNDGAQPLICSMTIAGQAVQFRAWCIHVGRCPIYLLDANVPANPPHVRDLTQRVYGGDSSTRIQQEMLLGVGGVRLLRALGHEPAVFHLNEGHAAFLTLELIREKRVGGQSYADALTATRQECIFTTHTPVPAGHDRFSSELVRYALGEQEKAMEISHEDLMALGRVNPNDANESFCMTVLALKASRATNGVSELHGQVSREMWRGLYPDRPVNEVPIGHITNGIHLLGWMKGPACQFWFRRLCQVAGELANGVLQHEQINNPDFWRRVDDPTFVTDEELWALRYRLRRELVEFIRSRVLHGGPQTHGDFIRYDQLLDVDTLTIGFARRFATYKRAPLIFDRFDDIVKLASNSQRPVQFIFSGKAHPADEEGKRYIQKIVHLSKHSPLKGRLVFLENYDVHISRQMVAGCDVWLNNPRRPLEASGTSGMKIGIHGGLNLSILDGWWREGFDGENGFAIGDDSHPNDIAEQDRRDSENLFRVLNEQVIPQFYERDAAGLPRRWLKRVRHAIATLSPKYSTWRMVQEYAQKYYVG